MKRLLTLCLSIAIAIATSAQEAGPDLLAQWHQWRGPLATGVAPRANPPLHWDATTNIKWKVKLPGSGSSTPIVWGDRIFLTAAVPPSTAAEPAAADLATGDRPGGRGGRGGMSVNPRGVHQFVVLCLDRGTGQMLWQRTAVAAEPHEGHHPSHGFASMSATTDGRKLYVSFGSRGIFCYDLDGEPQWQRDLGVMQTRMRFGEGSSPALYGDSLVVNWDHEGQSFIVCLNAETGTEKWRVDRDELTTWCTPLVTEHAGVTHVIVNGANRARSYNLANGELLWACGGQAGNPIASVVRDGDLVFCMTGFRGYALYAVPLDARGDITGTETIAWSRNRGTPYVASPLLFDGLLFFTRDRTGELTCLRAATGEELFVEQKLEGIREIYASHVGAAGRVYVTGRDGTTVVLRHGPEFAVLATNRLGEGIDATPVPIGRDMLLRGARHLYCVAEP